MTSWHVRAHRSLRSVERGYDADSMSAELERAAPRCSRRSVMLTSVLLVRDAAHVMLETCEDLLGSGRRVGSGVVR